MKAPHSLRDAMKGAAPAALSLLLAVSCIYENRADCPAPFSVTLVTGTLPDGSHSLAVGVKGGDEGFPLSADIFVDGKRAEGLVPERAPGGYPVEAGGVLDLSLPRMPSGRHTVTASVTDGDFTAGADAEIDVGVVSATAEFATVKGGATVATITLLEGDPVPYAASFVLDGGKVEGGDRTVTFGKDREVILTLPHREPGRHVLEATFANGGFSETIPFPFEAEAASLSLTVGLSARETTLGVTLEEGDINTEWRMEVSLDGKDDVRVSGKGFTYAPDRTVFPASRTLTLALPPVTDPGDHSVTVTLRDGSFSVSAGERFTVSAADPFRPGLTVVRSGKDAWDVTVTTLSGTPDGTYSVQGYLDGKAAPGFALRSGGAPSSVKFDADGEIKLRMGAVPIGTHTFTLKLTASGVTETLQASVTEDRLNLKLAFAQKVYGCHQGYFTLDTGQWTGNQKWFCVVHEDVTVTVDYGWKGTYRMEAYVDAANSRDGLKKVTRRRDEVVSSITGGKIAKDVPFEESADLTTGRCVVALPGGNPPVSGDDDRTNSVLLRLTPVWDGAATAEFRGSFETPFNRVNGLWLSSSDVDRTQGVDTWSGTSNRGVAYDYAVNGVTFKDVKNDGLVKDYGIFWAPYYVQNPPTLTVADPTVCAARVENTYNYINPKGLKEGSTTITVTKDDAVAVIKVTVVKTRGGNGFETIVELTDDGNPLSPAAD